MPTKEELVEKALLQAHPIVEEKFGIDLEKVRDYPDERLRYALLNLIEYFQSDDYDKKPKEKLFLSELKGALDTLDDEDRSILNTLEALKENIKELPVYFFSRGLMYETFYYITARLPIFQLPNLIEKIHQRLSDVSRDKRAADEKLDTAISKLDRRKSKKPHFFRGQKPPDDEAEEKPAATTTTVVTALSTP